MAMPKKKNLLVEISDRLRKEPAAWDRDGIPYEGHFTRAVFDRLLNRGEEHIDLTDESARQHDRILAAAFQEDRRTDGAAGAIAAFQNAYDAHASNRVAESVGRGWSEASVTLVARFLATRPDGDDVMKARKAGQPMAGEGSPYQNRLKEAVAYGLELDRTALDFSGNPDPARGELAHYLIHTEHLVPAMDLGWKPRAETLAFDRHLRRDIPSAPDHDFLAYMDNTKKSDEWNADNRPAEQRWEMWNQFSEGRTSPYRLDDRWRDMNNKWGVDSFRRDPHNTYKVYPGKGTIKAANMLHLVEKGYLDRKAIETVEFVTAAHQSQDASLLEATKAMDVNSLQNARGETALHALMRVEVPKDHKYFHLGPAMKAIRDFGFDPFQPDNSGKTPFEIGLETINRTESDGRRVHIIRDRSRTEKFLDRITQATEDFPLDEVRQPAYQVLALLTNDQGLAEKSGLTKRMAEHPESVAFEAARFSELTERQEPLDFFRSEGGRFETLQLAGKISDRSGDVYWQFQHAWKSDLEAEGKPYGADRETRVRAAAKARRERMTQSEQPVEASKTRGSAAAEIA